jgi:GMP synthase (glutamine-hydrolysing)
MCAGFKMAKLGIILVLDFGGQYCHLIGRRVRELKVYSEIAPPDIHPEEISRFGAKYDVLGLILSGGPSSVYDKGVPKADPAIFALGIPVLGICYGHQLIAHALGGKVKRAPTREYGSASVDVDSAIGLLSGLGRKEKVWMSHGDTVFKVPRGWKILAHTDNCPVAAYVHPERDIYGLQWHPEVVHTDHGQMVLRNFVRNICGAKAQWTMKTFVRNSINEIRSAVGSDRCIIGLSGGVDSSTAAVLASRAIGKRLTAVFVDHGFMREGEPEAIKRTFGKFPMKLICVNARKRFFSKLKGVKEPELKRKIIGHEFIRVFEEAARKEKASYLMQGTIYPDRIESGFRKHSDKIKSHHNVAGLPLDINFKAIVEPLRDLYKDEVRKVGTAAGLPRALVWRQPFPGPGLAVRIMGEITQEKTEIERKADHIVTTELEHAGIKTPWQYFAVLTETRSTGVKGDSRAYGYVVAVRAVESREAMTASFTRVPYSVLERISTRITNEIPQVNRVVYDITHKPPATIEWE